MSFLSHGKIHVLLALAVASLILVVYTRLRRTKYYVVAVPSKNNAKTWVEQDNPLAAYYAIDSLPDFDWRSTSPTKIRPFKPKYHLTMGECSNEISNRDPSTTLSERGLTTPGLETIPMSELLQMDNTYLSRIQLRRQIMDSHAEATLACNPVAEPATLELYEWLVGTYLPRRFPSCYELVSIETPAAEQHQQEEGQEGPTHLLNKTTSEHIPLQTTSPLTALRTLSSHIDTDFLILLPKQTEGDEENEPQLAYHLEAFSTTFPSGFSTLSKLGLPLSAIHTPVPQYARKIGKSMDRFFARLEVGKLVRRANWTITTTPELFVESGTHFHGFDEMSPAEQEVCIAEQRRELDVGEMRLRCERQTLMRLPSSGALVFAFKTYLTSLEEVKDEGNGEALAEATEGFLKGSVPEMDTYKRAVVWGDLVREFLRA
jgi:hypothetical protein